MSESPYHHGDRVEVFKGPQSVGVVGEVFRSEHTVRQFGDDESSIWEAWRLGIKDDLGGKHWVSAHNVRLASAPAPKAVHKGDAVRWRHQGREGTGIVFWVGKSKYGPELRVGLKDDATGESVWADAAEVHPSTRGGLQTLRDRLTEPPSADLWNELLALLNDWPPHDPGLAVAIDYAEAHMDATWPDALRTLPATWRVRMHEGQAVPGLRLVRHVAHAPLEGSRTRRESKNIVDALVGSDLRHATFLDLTGQNIGDKGLIALLEAGVFGRIKHLELAGNVLGDAAVVALAGSLDVAGLEVLGLEKTHVLAQGVTALATSPHLGALRLLKLSKQTGGVEGGQALLLSETLRDEVRLAAGPLLTLPQLRSIATKLGLAGAAKLPKAGLVAAIVEATRPAP